MATISFKGVNKIYDNNVQAVFDFNLEVADKEFIVLVGPSGCGKSTTLRMLAGFEDITSGEIAINGKVVNKLAPKDRDIAMVFQNYALYPHMTVYKNMQFALKLRKVLKPVLDENGKQVEDIDRNEIEKIENRIAKLDPIKDFDEIQSLKEEQVRLSKNPIPVFTLEKYTNAEMDAKIREVASMLGLEPYLKRKPGALSGGQRQRVALGRAMVRSPKVFLMDEPLSNLDAKLRVQTRTEIIKIHKEVEATTIYVTHDQVEAMTMATRIVVMKDGYIQQIGTPKEVYNSPSNIFVAGFIGSPSMNFLNGTFDGKSFILDNQGLSIALNKKVIESLKNYKDKKVIMGVRPDDIYLANNSNAIEPSKPFEAVCEFSELLGHEINVYTNVSQQKIAIKLSNQIEVNPEDKNEYVLDESKIHFFDPETTKTI